MANGKKRLTREQKAALKQKREGGAAARRALREPSVLIQEFWNVPNMMTVGRILLIPVFVRFTYDADPVYSLCAAAVFAVAAWRT